MLVRSFVEISGARSFVRRISNVRSARSQCSQRTANGHNRTNAFVVRRKIHEKVCLAYADAIHGKSLHGQNSDFRAEFSKNKHSRHILKDMERGGSSFQNTLDQVGSTYSTGFFQLPASVNLYCIQHIPLELRAKRCRNPVE